MMKRGFPLALALIAAALAACQPQQPACPTPAAALPASTEPALTPGPTSVEINHQLIAVDQVIEGQLCDGDWRGVVYVTCNVRVRPWVEQPDFLRGCNLTVEPGTTVYVAAHRNAPYYNGCSCHTGEVEAP